VATYGRGRATPGAEVEELYARYEQGVSVPTIEKLDELLKAVAPGRDLVLHQSAACR
jgi:hypothetical protein